MHETELAYAASTVLTLAEHMESLKGQAIDLVNSVQASTRGFFTPTEDEQTRHLLVSYWQSRNALFELVLSLHKAKGVSASERPVALVISYAGALVLVDVARFLRENFHHRSVVRAKLNEPEPHFGIPEGTYDTVQKSLTSPVHAWHLYHAMSYVTQNWDDLTACCSQQNDLKSVLDLIATLQERLDVSADRFVVARTRVQARSVRTKVRRDLIGRALYGLQKCVSSFMADKYVRLGHHPGLSPEIDRELENQLQPGDVIVVRKEHAFTNYFLPGYWPHAALYIGTVPELQQMRLHEHDNVGPRWSSVEAADPERPHRVLEAMKDGVRIRSLTNPFRSDAVAVIRPKLTKAEIAEAIGRGIFHAGKSYDFDFDFARSDRLVCTEVVYRSFEGVGGIEFGLTRRAGRMTLSAEDLLQKAVDGDGFSVHAVFCPAISTAVTYAESAAEILKQTIGRKSVQK